MMYTDLYAKRHPEMDTAKAINAIHEAWLQLSATHELARSEGYDNAPAIASLARCLKDAGHPGFQAVT